MTRFDFRSDRLFSLGHLRHGGLWLALGAALILMVVTGSLVSLPKPAAGLMMHDKLLHLAAYAAMMSWFAQLFRHDLTRLLLVIVFVTLGVLVECLQGLTPARQFDVVDMVANTSGVLLAWALAYTRLGDILPSIERRLGKRLARA